MNKPVDGAEALAREVLAAEYEATAPAGKYVARDIRSGILGPDSERAIRAMLAHSAALVAENERLRAYHAAVEQMVCVWAGGSNIPSSMDEEAWEEPGDDPDARWEKFIAARTALETRNG